MTYAPEHEKELRNRSNRRRMGVSGAPCSASQQPRTTENPHHPRDPQRHLLRPKERLRLAATSPRLPTPTTYEASPAYSLDGSKIVFTSYRFSFGGGDPDEDAEISVMNSDGTQRSNLTESSAYEDSPAFSPNGKRIAFSRFSFSRAE